jgi:probable phosphoglycerate mutase
MSATEIIVIRHGETAWNRELRFQGHIDVPLNALGLEQAQRLAERLSSEPVQRIYCSDLQRAQQTAAPTAKQLGLPVQLVQGLREQSYGVAEGLLAEDIRSQYPQAWQNWLRFDANQALPQGESTRAFHARVLQALGALAAGHADEKILVVTHGGVLDMLWRTAHGLSLDGPRQCAIPNAGLNRLRIDHASAPSRLEILAWADAQHLVGLPEPTVYPLHQPSANTA